VDKVPSQSFEDLLKAIPLQKRKELSTQIEDLCTHFQIPNTFLVNQLTLSGRRRAEATKATALLKKNYVPRYWVEIVGIYDPKPCTLAEAAKLMRVTETSLKVRVSTHRSFEKEITAGFSGKDRGHVDGYYICSKMTEEEADHFRDEFTKSLQQRTLTGFDIQSVSPARP
jgi:hypothetical protein